MFRSTLAKVKSPMVKRTDALVSPLSSSGKTCKITIDASPCYQTMDASNRLPALSPQGKITPMLEILNKNIEIRSPKLKEVPMPFR